MFSRWKRKKKVKRALKDLNLQTALRRASHLHYHQYIRTTEEVPWEEYKKAARAIREKNVAQLPALIQRFCQEAQKAGGSVYNASTAEEALRIAGDILRRNKAKLIVKSKSMVSEEIHLNSYLEKEGYRVVETDLGEWIIQLAKDRPSHITAPALHRTKEEIAQILSRALGRSIPPDSQEIVRVAREEMRQLFFQADVGISGANLAIAESGTLVILSNEGNARLVTGLPPIHIAFVTTEKFVETMDEAVALLKALTIASSGRKVTSYISFITGPSSTTDIEKEHILGVHGPREVHIIILDNGRLALAESEAFRDILYCLKCGGCMLVCPVFQSVGGHVFGGPVYPGGIGALLTAVTQSLDDASEILEYCADCKKCEDFCPVGIPTGKLLLKIKSAQGPHLGEKGLSLFFQKRSLADKAIKALSFFQRAWQKNGSLRSLPLSWAKGKRLPLLRLVKDKLPEGKKEGPRVYLFQGCLVRYFFPEVRRAALTALSHFGFRVVSPADQVCCGAPSLHLGDNRAVHDLAAKNLASFDKERPDYILTLCPTGHSLLKNHYPEFDSRAALWAEKVFDFTAFMASHGFFPQGKTADRKESLYYHRSCHYYHELKLADEPLRLLEALGYNLAPREEPPICCGFCGVFSLKNPAISSHLWGIKKKKVMEGGASLVATDCPGCLFQFRANLQKGTPPVPCFHTAEVLARALEGKS